MLSKLEVNIIKANKGNNVVIRQLQLNTCNDELYKHDKDLGFFFLLQMIKGLGFFFSSYD